MKRGLGVIAAGLVAGMLCAGAFGELTGVQKAEAEKLIGDFGSLEFKVRQEAVEKLIALGPEVGPMVEKVKETTDDDEVKLRCEQVLKALEKKTGPTTSTDRLTESVVQRLGEVHYEINFSPDGTRVTWVKGVPRGAVVVCNDEDGAVYANVGTQIFSPDSDRLAYPASRDAKWFMVTDDHEGEPYDEVSAAVFSADSKHLAYRAKKDGKWFLVVDDMKGKGYEEIGWQVTPMGEDRFAFRARQEGKWLIVTGNKEGKGYDAVGRPVKSKDGKRLAYWAKLGNESFVITDDVEGKHYAMCGNPVFSEDGKRLAYGGRKADGKWCVVVGGEEWGAYEAAGSRSPMGDEGPWQESTTVYQEVGARRGTETPVFSPDGKRVACAVREGGKWRVTCVGKEVEATGAKKAGEPTFERIGQITFSPDSSHLTYGGTRGELTYAVCDDMISEGQKHWYEGPMFSPDSKHLIWVLEKQDPRSGLPIDDWRVVVDGIRGGDYWVEQVTRDYMKTPGKLRFNGRTKEGGFLIEADWPKGTDWTRGMKKINEP